MIVLTETEVTVSKSVLVEVETYVRKSVIVFVSVSSTVLVYMYKSQISIILSKERKESRTHVVINPGTYNRTEISRRLDHGSHIGLSHEVRLSRNR